MARVRAAASGRAGRGSRGRRPEAREGRCKGESGKRRSQGADELRQRGERNRAGSQGEEQVRRGRRSGRHTDESGCLSGWGARSGDVWPEGKKRDQRCAGWENSRVWLEGRLQGIGVRRRGDRLGEIAEIRGVPLASVFWGVQAALMWRQKGRGVSRRPGDEVPGAGIKSGANGSCTALTSGK